MDNQRYIGCVLDLSTRAFAGGIPVADKVMTEVGRVVSGLTDDDVFFLGDLSGDEITVTAGGHVAALGNWCRERVRSHLAARLEHTLDVLYREPFIPDRYVFVVTDDFRAREADLLSEVLHTNRSVLDPFSISCVGVGPHFREDVLSDVFSLDGYFFTRDGNGISTWLFDRLKTREDDVHDEV